MSMKRRREGIRERKMRRASDSLEEKAAAAAALLSLASYLPEPSSASTTSGVFLSSRAMPVIGRGEAPLDGLVLLSLAAFHLRIVEFKENSCEQHDVTNWSMEGAVIRKARSKRRPFRKPGWGRPAQPGKKAKGSETCGEATVEESVLSSSSSCVTQCKESVRRPSVEKRESTSARTGKRRRYGNHPGIRRRAKAILEFLSAASSASSELHIRGVFGNSPDTSKALRILLWEQAIKRSGVGGRMDPFQYTVL